METDESTPEKGVPPRERDQTPAGTASEAEALVAIDLERVYNWILENLSQAPADCMGKCEEYCRLLVLEFPVLIVVRGHVFWDFDEFEAIQYRDGYPHFWAQTADGDIIDPTITQFAKPLTRYEPWDETRLPPTGKCPNCGGYCFNNKDFCSDACETEYMAYLNSPD